MTSPARAAANAANAQLSTGPRTEEGKTKSSRNALKYGLACEQNFIVPGEEEEFEELHKSLIENLAPRRSRGDAASQYHPPCRLEPPSSPHD